MKTLKDYVKNWINEIPKDEQESTINDVLQYGCVSGCVSELIYYKDTIKFYKDYENDINDELAHTMHDCGFDSFVELFGDKWDKEDPTALHTQNQNLLAWFGFENELRNVANELELIEL